MSHSLQHLVEKNRKCVTILKSTPRYRRWPGSQVNHHLLSHGVCNTILNSCWAHFSVPHQIHGPLSKCLKMAQNIAFDCPNSFIILWKTIGKGSLICFTGQSNETMISKIRKCSFPFFTLLWPLEQKEAIWISSLPTKIGVWLSIKQLSHNNRISQTAQQLH